VGFVACRAGLHSSHAKDRQRFIEIGFSEDGMGAKTCVAVTGRGEDGALSQPLAVSDVCIVQCCQS
jgi:hypothetical protein